MVKKKETEVTTLLESAEQEPEAEVIVKVEPLRVLSPEQIASREHAHQLKVVKYKGRK